MRRKPKMTTYRGLPVRVSEKKRIKRMNWGNRSTDPRGKARIRKHTEEESE